MSGDEISLTLPADEEFRRVAHLVVGGLAVRLDLTFNFQGYGSSDTGAG